MKRAATGSNKGAAVNMFKQELDNRKKRYRLQQLARLNLDRLQLEHGATAS